MGILGRLFFLNPEPGFRAAHLVSRMFSRRRTTSSKDSRESMLKTRIKRSPAIAIENHKEEH